MLIRPSGGLQLGEGPLKVCDVLLGLTNGLACKARELGERKWFAQMRKAVLFAQQHLLRMPAHQGSRGHYCSQRAAPPRNRIFDDQHSQRRCAMAMQLEAPFLLLRLTDTCSRRPAQPDLPEPCGRWTSHRTVGPSVTPHMKRPCPSGTARVLPLGPRWLPDAVACRLPCKKAPLLAASGAVSLCGAALQEARRKQE